MIARWVIFAALELLLSAVAVLLSPVLALLYVTRDSHPYCSATGPREYLHGWLHLFSTHDDGIDAGWFGGHYDDRAPAGWPQKARDGSRLHRWLLRMWWIARNSGYGFALHWFGFDRSGGYTSKFLAQRGNWDTSTTNWLVRVDTNAAGTRAFQVRAQIYLTAVRYVRVNIGWKLDWAADRVQLATHINPLREWK